jgi:MFS family permease
MSEPRIHGPLSALAAPIGEQLSQHQSLPPNKQAGNRAYLGAFLLGACGYVAVTLGPEAARYPDDWKLGFAVVAGFGLLLLVTGWRGARGGRDIVLAFFAVAVPLGGFLAVLNWAPQVLEFYPARAFCVAIASANVVRFWLAVRGPGGDAQKIVHRQIAQNEITWRGVKRHR